MTEPDQRSSHTRSRRVRELFDRAQSLPVEQRGAFVLTQTGDDAALQSEILALLRADDVDTTGIAAGARIDASTPPLPEGAEHVQSTATGELMEKLAKAPKLDEERFAVEKEVGKGGMGAVLRIHDRQLNRRLPLKVPL